MAKFARTEAAQLAADKPSNPDTTKFATRMGPVYISALAGARAARAMGLSDAHMLNWARYMTGATESGYLSIAKDAYPKEQDHMAILAHLRALLALKAQDGTPFYNGTPITVFPTYRPLDHALMVRDNAKGRAIVDLDDLPTMSQPSRLPDEAIKATTGIAQDKRISAIADRRNPQSRGASARIGTDRRNGMYCNWPDCGLPVSTGLLCPTHQSTLISARIYMDLDRKSDARMSQSPTSTVQTGHGAIGATIDTGIVASAPVTTVPVPHKPDTSIKYSCGKVWPSPLGNIVCTPGQNACPACVSQRKAVKAARKARYNAAHKATAAASVPTGTLASVPVALDLDAALSAPIAPPMADLLSAMSSDQLRVMLLTLIKG